MKHLLILLLFSMACTAQPPDYKVIHSGDHATASMHYFNAGDVEYARVYGNDGKGDSLTFGRKNNDLIVREFKYMPQPQKRVANGTIRYVNFYAELSDIVTTGNPQYMDEIPVQNFNFLTKERELEQLIRENCTLIQEQYKDCDFSLPKSTVPDYFPETARITSAVIKKDKNQFVTIELTGQYFEQHFRYKRDFHYNNNKLAGITTVITDDDSANVYEDTYTVVAVQSK